MLSDLEFDLQKFDTQSLYLWACPPTSIECLDLVACIDVWMGGLLPDARNDRDIADGGRSTPTSARADATPDIISNQWSGRPGSRDRTESRERNRTVSLGPSVSGLRTHNQSFTGINIRNGLKALASKSRGYSEHHGVQDGRESPEIVSSVNNLKGRIRDRLVSSAERREYLEPAWADRERVRHNLLQTVEEQAALVQVLEDQHSDIHSQEKGRRRSHGLVLSSRASDQKDHSLKYLPPFPSSAIENMDPVERDRALALGALEGKKKDRRVGSKIRGMFSSASIHGGLSSWTEKAKPTMSRSSTNMSKASPKIPSDITETKFSMQLANSSPDISSRLSLQIPSPLLDEGRNSPYRIPTPRPAPFDGELLSDPQKEGCTSLPSPHPSSLSLPPPTPGVQEETPTMQSAPSLPKYASNPGDAEVSPCSFQGVRKFPTFRDLQNQSVDEVMEEETLRVRAGRKKEGLVWSPGIWEGVANSGNKTVSEKKEKVKWESECFGSLGSTSKRIDHREFSVFQHAGSSYPRAKSTR